jgi:methionine-rich copper-binding protein CopC
VNFGTFRYNRIMIRRAILLTLSILALSFSTALAHSYIERTSPRDGETLREAPNAIQVWFSDPLVPDTGRITLTNAQGEDIPLSSAKPDEDSPTLLVANLTDELPNGTYIASVAGLATDGHRSTGTFTFQVEAPAPSYSIMALFGMIFGLTLLGGYFWIYAKPNDLDITPPAEESQHFKLI